MTSHAVTAIPWPGLGSHLFPRSPRTSAIARRRRVARPADLTRWLARGLVVAGLALVPWLLVLARSLPSSARAWHWSAAWIGLDSLEILGLLGTGLLLLSGDARYRLTAAATAALLLVDAWFDVVTSAPGGGQLAAAAMALCLELPISALCAVLAVKAPIPPPDVTRYLGRSLGSALGMMARATRITRFWRMSTYQPDGPHEAVISVSDLRMRYGTRDALNGLSFTVHRGELFALLGPNGAGKTSTTEILEGYRRRTGGQVSVLGTDPWQAGPGWRSKIGVMLQETGPEPDLKVVECLRLYGGYYADPWPAGDLLELTGLASQASTRTSQLSGGQRRKLDLALALTGRPQVLFLDEPTTGFDPAARHDAWAAIAALKDSGTTIILTTHYMEEAERLADRVAVITEGRLAYQGPPGNLPGRHATPTIVFALPPALGTQDLPEQVRAAVASSADGRVTLTADQPLRVLRVLAEWADNGGYDITDIDVFRPSLEDAYLQLTAASDAEAAR